MGTVLEQLAQAKDVLDLLKVALALCIVSSVTIIGVMWRAISAKEKEHSQHVERLHDAQIALVKATAEASGAMQSLMLRVSAQMDDFDGNRFAHDLVVLQQGQAKIHESLVRLESYYGMSTRSRSRHE